MPLNAMVLSLKTSAEILLELADRTRELRLERDWSQEEMARRSGIKTATYRLFEQTGKISLQRFVKILEALGRAADFDQLLNRRELPQIRDLQKAPRQRGKTKTRP